VPSVSSTLFHYCQYRFAGASVLSESAACCVTCPIEQRCAVQSAHVAAFTACVHQRDAARASAPTSAPAASAPAAAPSTSSPPPPPSTVFVVHDAGESFMLQPVLRLLAAAHARVDHSPFIVFALGEPAISIFQSDHQLASLTVTPAALGIHERIIDGDAGRIQVLSAAAVARILAAFQPRVVVLGMAYRMQAQLGHAFREAGGGGAQTVVVVGVDDSFALWSWDSLAATVFVPIVTEFVLTAASQAQAIQRQVWFVRHLLAHFLPRILPFSPLCLFLSFSLFLLSLFLVLPVSACVCVNMCVCVFVSTTFAMRVVHH
jgi:hypothetical protein